MMGYCSAQEGLELLCLTKQQRMLRRVMEDTLRTGALSAVFGGGAYALSDYAYNALQGELGFLEAIGTVLIGSCGALSGLISMGIAFDALRSTRETLLLKPVQDGNVYYIGEHFAKQYWPSETGRELVIPTDSVQDLERIVGDKQLIFLNGALISEIAEIESRVVYDGPTYGGVSHGGGAGGHICIKEYSALFSLNLRGDILTLTARETRSEPKLIRKIQRFHENQLPVYLLAYASPLGTSMETVDIGKAASVSDVL